MKRTFLFLIIIIIVIIIVTFPNFETKNNASLKNSKSNNSLSIMLQDENGKYQEGDSSFNKEEYHFNSIRSKCLMGGKIKYDYDDKSLIVNTTKSDRCYAYFDNNNFVEDLSGNGNHGKVINIVDWTKDGITTSDLNTSGYVDCGLAGYDFKNKLSVVMRVRYNDFRNAYSCLIGNMGELSATRHGFYITNNDNVPGMSLVDFYGGYHPLSFTNKIELNKWYTMIITYDNEIISFYLNNDVIFKKNQVNALSVSDLPIFLGGYSMHDENGNVAKHKSDYGYNTFSDLLIYNRALTEEEITKDYANKINPTNKENLLLWYKF